MLADNTGQVSLIQQFPGSAEQVLFKRGSGNGEAVRLTTSNPAWQIEFKAGSGLSHSSADPLLLVGAALLALLGGLFGMLWLQRSWTSSLRTDSHTLTQLTLGHKAAGLELSPLEPLAQNIMQLVKRSGQTLGASPKREDAPAVETKARKKAGDNLTNPLFQDTDILDIDIDILDDGDPFAMSETGAPAAPSIPALPNGQKPDRRVRLLAGPQYRQRVHRRRRAARDGRSRWPPIRPSAERTTHQRSDGERLCGY